VNVLIIGGTSFIGPAVVKRLVAGGHEVTVFHRGQSEADLPASVRHIHGDQNRLIGHRAEIEQIGPDAIIAMMVLDRGAAEAVCGGLSGLVARLIVLSSIDVYRNYGRLIKTEPGVPDPIPLAEDAPLREKLYPFGGTYDKTEVEAVVMGQEGIDATIVRLPMVYGEGDYQHRLFGYLKRMDDGRPAIVLPDEYDMFRISRAHVENVAAGIALVAMDERAKGRIYNIAELEALTEREWIEAVGKSVGWRGRVVTVPQDALPEGQRSASDLTAHLAVDSARIRAELGYQEPVAFEEGLARTIAWERANPPANLKAEDFDYNAEDALLAGLS